LKFNTFLLIFYNGSAVNDFPFGHDTVADNSAGFTFFAENDTSNRRYACVLVTPIDYNSAQNSRVAQIFRIRRRQLPGNFAIEGNRISSTCFISCDGFTIGGFFNVFKITVTKTMPKTGNKTSSVFFCQNHQMEQHLS